MPLVKRTLLLSIVTLASSCGVIDTDDVEIEDKYYLMALYEGQLDEAIQSTVLLHAIEEELETGDLLSEVYEVEKLKIRMALISVGRAVEMYDQSKYNLTKQMMQLIELKSPITRLSMIKIRDEYEDVWNNGDPEEIRLITLGFKVYCMYGNPYSYRIE